MRGPASDGIINVVSNTDMTTERGLDPSLLVLVVSCAAHNDSWPDLARWGRRVDAPNMMVLSGGPLAVPYEVRTLTLAAESVRILDVNSSDMYLGLSQKMFMAWHAIASLEDLSHVTHVLKVDDTVLFDKSGPWAHFDAGALERQLRANATLAATHYGGRHVVRSRLSWPGHINKIQRQYICERHPTELDRSDELSQYWRNKILAGSVDCTDFNAAVPFAGGDGGYLMSRHAVELAVSVVQWDQMETLSQTAWYGEDLWLGQALNRRCIEPVHLEFPGLPAFIEGPDGGEPAPPDHVAPEPDPNSTCAYYLSHPALWYPALNEHGEDGCLRCEIGKLGWCCPEED